MNRKIKMRPEYFIIRMYCDHNGDAIPGSEEIIGHIDDQDAISEAEANHALRKVRGEAGLNFIVEEAAKIRKRKSDRPTVPELPMVDWTRG